MGWPGRCRTRGAGGGVLRAPRCRRGDQELARGALAMIMVEDMASTENPLRVPTAPILLAVPEPRPEIFQVFAIPDFAGRMASIRSEVSPWLARIGDAFVAPLST